MKVVVHNEAGKWAWRASDSEHGGYRSRQQAESAVRLRWPEAEIEVQQHATVEPPVAGISAHST